MGVPENATAILECQLWFGVPAGYEWRGPARADNGPKYVPAVQPDCAEADLRLAETILDLRENGWQDGMAGAFADPVWARVTEDWEVDRCEALAATADLFDLLYKKVQSGISGGVRLVVGLFGVPGLVGDLVARAVTALYFHTGAARGRRGRVRVRRLSRPVGLWEGVGEAGGRGGAEAGV